MEVAFATRSARSAGLVQMVLQGLAANDAAALAVLDLDVSAKKGGVGVVQSRSMTEALEEELGRGDLKRQLGTFLADLRSDVRDVRPTSVTRSTHKGSWPNVRGNINQGFEHEATALALAAGSLAIQDDGLILTSASQVVIGPRRELKDMRRQSLWLRGPALSDIVPW